MLLRCSTANSSAWSSAVQVVHLVASRSSRFIAASDQRICDYCEATDYALFEGTVISPVFSFTLISINIGRLPASFQIAILKGWYRGVLGMCRSMRSPQHANCTLQKLSTLNVFPQKPNIFRTRSGIECNDRTKFNVVLRA